MMGPRMIFTEVVKKEKGKLNPVIVEFQNGELNSRKLKNIEVTTSLSSNDSRTNVEISTPQGHKYVDACNSKSPFKNILAIRNKRTKKVRLVEVDYSLLINSVLNEVKEITPTAAAITELSVDLQKKFGGKKAKRNLEQREKLNVDTSLAEEGLKEIASAVDTSQPVMSLSGMEDESLLSLIPPCNRKATRVSDAYHLLDIINEQELNSAEEAVNSFMDNADVPLSIFTADCMEVAKNSNVNLRQRLAALFFVDCMIDFIKLPARKLQVKSLRFSQISSMDMKIRNEFCVQVNNNLTRPITMKDKCLCHIITLCLLCCENKINIEALAKEVSIPLKKLEVLARLVGAYSPPGSHVFYLTVPIPPLPKTNRKKFNKK